MQKKENTGKRQKSKTRVDTRLPKPRAGRQGQWWNRPAKLLGRSRDLEIVRKRQKSKVLGTDEWTDGQRVLELHARN